MIRAGEKRIWKPVVVTIDDNGVIGTEQELSHPWYGSKVTVLEVQEIQPLGRQYLVKPVNAPKVNNPDAFKFWTWEVELEAL